MSRVKEEDDLVSPGDVITDGDTVSADSGAYEENNKIYSKYLGTVHYSGQEVEVRPTSGRYMPSGGDTIIGEVTRVSYSRWTVEFNSAYEGSLNIADATDEYVDLDEDDLSDFYEVGDAVVIKIKSVTDGMDVDLSMKDKRCRKLEGGRIIDISPSKVPRVIGKEGTMVKQINEKTNCNIIVGQNGQVWISGDKSNLAARAVKKVEEEAHTEKLTDSISEWLDEELESMEAE